MKLQTKLPTLQIALAAGGVAATALLVTWALSAIARPAQLDTRVSAIEAEVTSATRKLRGRGLDPVFPSDAVCAGPLPTEAARLSSAIGALSSAGAPSTKFIEVIPDASASAGGLTPLRVRVETTGTYEGASSLLSALGALRPVIFIDTVDLVSKTSAVTLVVSGRAYCSVPA